MKQALLVALGILVGTASYFLLALFCRCVLSPRKPKRWVLFCVLMLAAALGLPMGALVLCAVLAPGGIAWMGYGVGGAVPLVALSHFFLRNKRKTRSFRDARSFFEKKEPKKL